MTAMTMLKIGEGKGKMGGEVATKREEQHLSHRTGPVKLSSPGSLCANHRCGPSEAVMRGSLPQT